MKHNIVLKGYGAYLPTTPSKLLCLGTAESYGIEQIHITPGVGMESLYTEINETHTGTEDDPIPYSGNMALEQGKYYMQDYEIYLCTRDTLISVHNPLSELVGIYVELV